MRKKLFLFDRICISENKIPFTSFASILGFFLLSLLLLSKMDCTEIPLIFRMQFHAQCTIARRINCTQAAVMASRSSMHAITFVFASDTHISREWQSVLLAFFFCRLPIFTLFIGDRTNECISDSELSHLDVFEGICVFTLHIFAHICIKMVRLTFAF